MAVFLVTKPEGSKESPDLVLLLPKGRGQKRRWALACFGTKRHYHKDGTCRHTKALLAHMRPWYRSRTDVTPWGGHKP